MKIETACLEHGAPIRRIVFDDAAFEASEKSSRCHQSPWAWAAALAGYALGRADDANPKSQQEIETR